MLDGLKAVEPRLKEQLPYGIIISLSSILELASARQAEWPSPLLRTGEVSEDIYGF